jgi:hypothetical protein
MACLKQRPLFDYIESNAIIGNETVVFSMRDKATFPSSTPPSRDPQRHASEPHTVILKGD